MSILVNNGHGPLVESGMKTVTRCHTPVATAPGETTPATATPFTSWGEPIMMAPASFDEADFEWVEDDLYPYESGDPEQNSKETDMDTKTSNQPLPPLFLAFLKEVFLDEADDAAEQILDCFFHDQEAQIILVGAGSTGKSTLEKILLSAVPRARIYDVGNVDHCNPGKLGGVPPASARFFLHFRRVLNEQEQDPLIADRIIAAEVDLIRAWALAR
jgi:hypothetical protein